MKKSEVEQKLQAALDQLVRDHGALFRADVNERSLTHWLAVLLAPKFDGWNVDCEYNRDGNLPKRIPPAQNASTADLNAPTVYPDVIVHRRGSADNLLVVEAKKHNAPSGFDADKRKLEGYLLAQTDGGLGYRFGALVVFDVGTNLPSARIEVLARGEA